MKKDLHPAYYQNAKVKCACGTTYTIGATRQEIKIEICAKCHPFYTGEKKLIDTAGRVERFKRRTTKAETAPAHKNKKEKRAIKKTKRKGK